MAQNSDKRNSTYELLKRDETTTVQSSTSINRLSSLLPIQIQKSSPRPRESPLPTTLPSPRLGGSQLRNWRSGRCNGKKGDESWRQKKCGQGKRIERGDVGREVKRRGEKNCLNKLPPPPLISRQLTCCSVDEGCIDEHERKKWERKKKKRRTRRRAINELITRLSTLTWLFHSRSFISVSKKNSPKGGGSKANPRSRFEFGALIGALGLEESARAFVNNGGFFDLPVEREDGIYSFKYDSKI